MSRRHEEPEAVFESEADRVTAGLPLDSWSEIALAARPELVSIARRVVRDHSEAEDVVDEAIARLAATIDDGGAIDSIVGWLHRAALRIAVDRARAWIRRQRETWRYDVAQSSARRSAVDPSAALDSVETRERLWCAILELPERQRDAVVLRQLEGLTYAAVADRLGIEEGTARGHVHAARASLRKTLWDLTEGGDR